MSSKWLIKSFQEKSKQRGEITDGKYLETAQTRPAKVRHLGLALDFSGESVKTFPENLETFTLTITLGDAGNLWGNLFHYHAIQFFWNVWMVCQDVKSFGFGCSSKNINSFTIMISMGQTGSKRVKGEFKYTNVSLLLPKSLNCGHSCRQTCQHKV